MSGFDPDDGLSPGAFPDMVSPGAFAEEPSQPFDAEQPSMGEIPSQPFGAERSQPSFGEIPSHNPSGSLDPFGDGQWDGPPEEDFAEEDEEDASSLRREQCESPQHLTERLKEKIRKNFKHFIQEYKKVDRDTDKEPQAKRRRLDDDEDPRYGEKIYKHKLQMVGHYCGGWTWYYADFYRYSAGLS